MPYTLTLFMMSRSWVTLPRNWGVISGSIMTISEMGLRGIMLLVLSPLIFESAFNSDWYIFRKYAVIIFIVACPSVLSQLSLLSLKVVIQLYHSFYNWPEAFLFSSVLYWTDIVAVLTLQISRSPQEVYLYYWKRELVQRRYLHGVVDH